MTYWATRYIPDTYQIHTRYIPDTYQLHTRYWYTRYWYTRNMRKRKSIYWATKQQQKLTAGLQGSKKWIRVQRPNWNRIIKWNKFYIYYRVNYDNVTELEYLDMVLSESMRVYPPIPLHIGKYCFIFFRREKTEKTDLKAL